MTSMPPLRTGGVDPFRPMGVAASSNNDPISLGKRIESSFFFVLYVMSSTTNGSLWWPVLRYLSEFVSFSGFLLSPYMWQYGPLTQPYANVLITLQLISPMALPEFLMRFAVLTALSIIVILLAISVMQSHAAKSFRRVWPVRLLIVISIVLRLLTTGSVSTLLASLMCNPKTGQLFVVAGVPCWQVAWIPLGFIGVGTLIVLYFFMLAVCISSAHLQPPKDIASLGFRLAAVAVPEFRIHMYGVQFMFIVARLYLFDAILPSAAYAALIYLFGMLYVTAWLFKDLPYVDDRTNLLYGATYVMFIWWAVVAWCAAISPAPLSAFDNRWVDYAVLVGAAPTFALGYFAMRKRLDRATSIADYLYDVTIASQAPYASGSSAYHGHASNTNPHENHRSPSSSPAGGCPVFHAPPMSSGRAAAHHDVESVPPFSVAEMAHKLQNNMLLLPKLQSIADVKLVARILERQNRGLTSIAFLIAASRVHLTSAYVHFLAARAIEHMRDPSWAARWTPTNGGPPKTTATAAAAAAVTSTLPLSPSPLLSLPLSQETWNAIAPTLPYDAPTYERIKDTLSPEYSVRYLLFQRVVEQDQRAATAGALGGGTGAQKLDLLQYVELQRAINEAQRYHSKCIGAIQQFWLLFVAASDDTAKEVLVYSSRLQQRTAFMSGPIVHSRSDAAVAGGAGAGATGMSSAAAASRSWTPSLSRSMKRSATAEMSPLGKVSTAGQHPLSSALPMRAQSRSSVLGKQGESQIWPLNQKDRTHVIHVSFASFQNAAKAIMEHTETANAYYQQLLVQFPQATNILLAYASFARLVLHDSTLADRYDRMAKEAKHQEEEQTELDINDALRARAALEETVDVAQTLDPRIAVSRSEHEPVHQAPFGATAVPGPSIGAPALLGRSGGAHRNAVIAINDLGQIEEVNQGALSLFGIESSRELRGRNVNVIMPEPYRSFHDGWISSYRQAANKPTLGTPRIVFGHHSRGWSFPIQLRIMESFESPTSKHQFVGLITPLPVQSRTGAIIISTKGVIQLVERSICTMFNYKPNELVGHNISILMPRELAVQHDMILARYAGPAKSRVVGIPTGRFLMGQSKNGVLFPISVEVYEEYIGSVLFFRGAIRDLTLLVGEAFLDAAGTLVNCNDDLLGMFGYKRPAIIGQNLRVLFAEPFRTFCESYLKRQVDQRQDGAANSHVPPNGRILTALFSDGSPFTIRLNVERAGNSFVGNQVQLRATITRVADNAENYVPSPENKLQIDEAGNIQSVGKHLTSMLKHTSDQDFVGKSISAILPPFGDLPTQNSVSTLLTELLSCQNRWCFAKLLTRDCRVLPVVLLPASAPVVAASAYTQSSEPGAMLHVQVHDLVNKDVLLVLDSSFLIRHATATITMLLGRSAEEVVGKHITHLIPDFSAELALKQQDDTTTDRSRETFLAIHPEDLRRFSARYSNGTLFGVLVEVLRAMDSPPLAGDSSTTPITKETTYCARISVLDTGRQLTGRTLGALVDKVQMMTSPMGSGLVHHPDTTRSYAAIWSSAANLRLDPSRLRDEAELGSVSLEAMDTEAGATSAAQQARAIKSMRFSPSTAGNGSSSGGMTRRDTDSTSMPSSLPSSNVLRSLGSLPELPAVTTTAPSMTRAPTEPRPSPLPSPHFPSMDKSTSQAAAATAAALASGGTRSLKRRMSGAGPSSELGNSGNSAATAVARVPLPTSESDVALNRVVRDTLMILAWRMVPINPMFHGFQRRLLIGFSVVLCSLVATVVVLRQAQLDGNPMQLLSASSEIAVLMTEINIAAELVALCLPGSGAFAAAAWALPICTNPTPDARLTALSTTLAAASRSLINQARVIPTFSSHLPLNISVMQFMDANPAVSVPEMIPDIWQLIVKVSTSATNVATLFAAASAGGAGGANIAMSGDWQFLVANKNTIAAAAEAVTLGSYNAVVTSLTRVYAVIFGTAGAFIFLSLTVYCVWLLPELRVMNRARGRVFELLLQLPQRVASHMVYHVYRAMESSDGHEVNGSDESDSYLDLDLSLSTCTSVDDGEFAQPPIYVRPSTLVRGSGGPGALITQLQAPLRPRAATSGGQSSQLASSLASSGGGGGGASSFGRRPSADAVMELVGSKGNKPVAPRAFSLSRQGASGAPYPPPHLPPAGSDPLALSGDGHASQKRRRASKKVINYVARNSITPVVMFSVIFLSIVVPGALYLAINSLQSVTRVQAHFDQVNTSLTLLLAATRGASDAIAGTRVGWSHDRLVGSSTKIASTFQLVYAGILGLTEADTGVTAQALLERPFAAQPSMDALQALDHTVAIEPLPARIAALGSATGLQFVISGAISSLQSFAAASTLQPSSPSAAIASSPSLQQALVVQVQSVPMQLYLGLGLLLRLEMVGGLSDINAMLSNGYLIHLGMLGQLLVVFGGAWVMQARTRKEIKRNCFLLLMVPPSVIVKNREMAQYLRSVTTMLRGRLPAQALASALDNTVTAAPAAVGSKGVRRT